MASTFRTGSRALPGAAGGLPISISSSRCSHRILKTLPPGTRGRRLVVGRLSHYSALYEVQNQASPGLPLAAVHHLHHMVHGSGSSSALGPLYLATFCALSVTLGALLFNLTNVLNEYFALQQQLTSKQEDKPLLYGVDVSGSTMFKSKRVRAAAAFAAAAHAGQVRKTGEPYVTHCIETALIVESNLPHWRQDSRHEIAVIAALLHDVLDDTATTPEDLTAAFGPTVTAMVVSVSKLSAVNQMLRRDKRKGVVRRDQSFWQAQWRRLKRMMFEAVVEEPLVILVKLADRLHNMRTVYALPPAKQQAVAEETLAVWCSMAASLGWHSLKSEMEDLCFAVLDTSTFCSLRQQLDKLWSSPPPPRSRRRVKSSRRQLQLQQFAEQQQQLAAERAGKWGQGLVKRLQQGLLSLNSNSPSAAATNNSSSSGSGGSGSGGEAAAAASEPSQDSHQQPEQQQQPQQQQQQRGLNLLLHGLWPQGSSSSSTAAAAGGSGQQGLLPAPPMSPTASADDLLVVLGDDPKRPSGAEWGVTDAALSLRSLLTTSLAGTAAGASSSSSAGGGAAAAAAATAAVAPQSASSSSSSGKAGSSSKRGSGQLSAQQQQLRNILSTVVPFDAVSLTGSNPGLTWSAQQGLGVLQEAAGRLYNELAVGSFSGGLKVEIQGRLKSLRSVHNKMERKRCSVEEVYDARALRVVVDDGGGARLADAVQCCYRLVSAVHKLWRPIHGEFDDYIANPKPSGYQALHTAVWGPGGAALEVQIKTAGMHEHAEYGGAAHWAYKEVLWGSAPAAAAAVDSVERNVAAAAAAAAVAAGSSSGQQQQRPLAAGAAAVAAGAGAMLRPSNVQVLPTVLFTFDDEGQLVSSTGSSSSTSSTSGGLMAASVASLASYDAADAAAAVALQPAAAAATTAARSAAVATATAAAPPAYAAAAAAGSAATTTASRAGGGVQLAERPRSSNADGLSLSAAAAAALASRQQAAAGGVGTLQRPLLSLPKQPAAAAPLPQLPRSQGPPQGPSQQQEAAPRLAPEVYIGQPVLRVSDRLRYGVVLAATNPSGRDGTRGGTPLLQLSPQGLSLTAAAAAAPSGSSSSSTLTCVIMSGGTNPDHPWRMPDYGFYEQLLRYATAQGWVRPGQGDWHARLEEYEWCRDGRWHRRDHMGYLHPHTTLTLLEGYEQDAAEAAAEAAADAAAASSTPAAAAAAPAAALAAAGATSSVGSRVQLSAAGLSSMLARSRSSTSSRGSSRRDVPVGAAASAAGVQQQTSGAVGVSAASTASSASTLSAGRTPPDAAMLRHSWATGGTGSSWRQQQKQKQQKQQEVKAAAAVSGSAARADSDAATWSSSSSSAEQQQALPDAVAAAEPITAATTTGSSSEQPAYAGVAAAGASDWAATAAKAAQLRSVIEWGLEAYGVNAAGSEPSNEVSVVIWPGGSIEDVPRGTTAGQILRDRGVFAILSDPSASASSSSSSSDSDAEAAATATAAATAATADGSSRGSSMTGRSYQQQQAQQERQQAQQQVAAGRLVNVNNRLVAEDTVLRDGDLVILAREKIKI